MASVNKVILVGNLGADPEISYGQSGNAICNLRVATTDSWKDKATGEKKESTEWHRVVLYRGLAEIAGRYLKKGSQVYVEGSIHTRKWQDKNGVDRYTTEIEADEMTMLDERSAALIPIKIAAAESIFSTDELLGIQGKILEPAWLDKLPF